MEEEGILSESQQGFRPMRGVTDAIRMATSAIEDAYLAHQDLHITYVDFFRAFNTVSHDGLKRLLTLLGFPEDAVAVVCSIYEEATTSELCQHRTERPNL